MKNEAFIKMPRALLASDAWRSLSINARRFVDFLMLEHMSHGGRKNGLLLAPRRQLEQAGIGAQYISSAVEETASQGLVLVKRGSGRQPNTYALSWLPLLDGSKPDRPWAGGGVATSEGKSLRLTYDRKHLGSTTVGHKGRSDLRTEVANGRSDLPSGTAQREAPYKSHDLTKAGVTSLMSVGRGAGGVAGPRGARSGSGP